MLLSSLTFDAAAPARRVIVLVLDGLRADLVGDERFPNLARLHATSAATPMPPRCCPASPPWP